jgi:hypothetical protein
MLPPIQPGIPTLGLRGATVKPSTTFVIAGTALVAAMAWREAPARVAHTTTPAPSRVDWARIGETIVKRGLALQQGDRVALFSDHTSDRGATHAVRAAIAAAGAVAIEANVPSMAELEASRRLPTAMFETQLAARDRLWTAAFGDLDAVIWLASSLTSMPGRPIERLVERTGVRALHFHWPLPTDTADIHWVEERYARAVAVEPATLDGKMQAIARMLDGAKVRITSPNGTDFTFTVGPDAWVHRNTGDATRAKTATARTIRDREEELPAGALRTTDVGAGSGVLVGHAGYSTHAPMIRATFRDGRVTRFESSRGAEANVAAWEQATGDKFTQGDFILGVNHELPRVSPSGFIPYYGYGAGVVRVVIGDNWESGGKNRSSNGETPFVLVDATVEVNGRVLVREGVLIGP